MSLQLTPARWNLLFQVSLLGVLDQLLWQAVSGPDFATLPSLVSNATLAAAL
jgi:hypothetical protein